MDHVKFFKDLFKSTPDYKKKYYYCFSLKMMKFY